MEEEYTNQNEVSLPVINIEGDLEDEQTSVSASFEVTTYAQITPLNYFQPSLFLKK